MILRTVQVLRKLSQEEFEPMRWMMTLTAAAALAASSYACGSGPATPSGTGTLNLRITDSPYSDAKALLVTFSEVTAHKSETEGRTTLAFAGGATTRTCDLKKLQSGAQDILGVGTLPAGHYTMVRLVVSSAALYFDNASEGAACAATITPPAGRTASLTIPSGEVKLNREFDVAASGSTTMLIDFDGDRSVVELGNGGYRMTPVIGVLSVQ
jgi:hypothetical protein